MKKYSLGLLFVAILTLISCTEDNSLVEQMELEANTPVMIEKSLIVNATPMPETCSSANLIAGQNIDAGFIEVTADDDYVYVTYNTATGWYLDATHLYVGDCDVIPTTTNGNPKIGHFPYKADHAPGTNAVTYTINKADLASSFCMGAHAVVSKVDSNGNVEQSETAWGEGFLFGGSSWAMLQQIETTGCYFNPEEPVRRR